MPTITRPDGATIHYEVFGSGFPLLLIAPGGVSSEISIWSRSAINPIQAYAENFTVIAMDQRHAGTSLAPMRPFSYDQCNGDQLAVLDALGFERAHVMGGCIGCAHIWNLVENAPERIVAAVTQDPVGLDDTNDIGVFYAMFAETMRLARAEGLEAVIKAAQENAFFMANNAAGPFAPLLAASEEARTERSRWGANATSSSSSSSVTACGHRRPLTSPSPKNGCEAAPCPCSCSPAATASIRQVSPTRSAAKLRTPAALPPIAATPKTSLQQSKPSERSCWSTRRRGAVGVRASRASPDPCAQAANTTRSSPSNCRNPVSSVTS